MSYLSIHNIYQPTYKKKEIWKFYLLLHPYKHYEKSTKKQHIKHGSGDGPQVNIMDFLKTTIKKEQTHTHTHNIKGLSRRSKVASVF